MSAIAIVIFAVVGAQEYRNADTERLAMGSAEVLQEAGVIAADTVTPLDLAALPVEFWPAGVIFDSSDLSLTLATGATIRVDSEVEGVDGAKPRNASARRSTYRGAEWVDKKFEVRLEFAAAIVDRDGNAVFIAPNGIMTFQSVEDRAAIEVTIEPLSRREDAFWPSRFISPTPTTGEEGIPEGGVAGGGIEPADAGGGLISCRCDKANCGGGCTKTKCENLTTCSGGCGSCAFTCEQCQ